MSLVDVFQLVRLDERDALFAVLGSIDINQSDEWGGNLLHQAISYRNTTVAEELIRRGIDVNHQNEDGDTPLHIAAVHQNLSVAKSIIASGGDVNICDRLGSSPLSTAVFEANKKINQGEYAMVELLLKHNADPHHKDNYGMTPIDIARRSNNSELLRVLESGGNRNVN